MDLITADECDGLFASFRREALHLKMRDAYGTEAEIPHMAKWAAGEPDDLERLHGPDDPTLRAVRRHLARIGG